MATDNAAGDGGILSMLRSGDIDSATQRLRALGEGAVSGMSILEDIFPLALTNLAELYDQYGVTGAERPYFELARELWRFMPEAEREIPDMLCTFLYAGCKFNQPDFVRWVLPIVARHQALALPALVSDRMYEHNQLRHSAIYYVAKNGSIELYDALMEACSGVSPLVLEAAIYERVHAAAVASSSRPHLPTPATVALSSIPVTEEAAAAGGTDAVMKRAEEPDPPALYTAVVAGHAAFVRHVLAGLTPASAAARVLRCVVVNAIIPLDDAEAAATLFRYCTEPYQHDVPRSRFQGSELDSAAADRSHVVSAAATELQSPSVSRRGSAAALVDRDTLVSAFCCGRPGGSAVAGVSGLGAASRPRIESGGASAASFGQPTQNQAPPASALEATAAAVIEVGTIAAARAASLSAASGASQLLHQKQPGSSAGGVSPTASPVSFHAMHLCAFALEASAEPHLARAAPSIRYATWLLSTFPNIALHPLPRMRWAGLVAGGVGVDAGVAPAPPWQMPPVASFRVSGGTSLAPHAQPIRFVASAAGSPTLNAGAVWSDWTPFHSACAAGSLELAQLIAARAPACVHAPAVRVAATTSAGVRRHSAEGAASSGGVVRPTTHQQQQPLTQPAALHPSSVSIMPVVDSRLYAVRIAVESAAITGNADVVAWLSSSVLPYAALDAQLYSSQPRGALYAAHPDFVKALCKVTTLSLRAFKRGGGGLPAGIVDATGAASAGQTGEPAASSVSVGESAASPTGTSGHGARHSLHHRHSGVGGLSASVRQHGGRRSSNVSGASSETGGALRFGLTATDASLSDASSSLHMSVAMLHDATGRHGARFSGRGGAAAGRAGRFRRRTESSGSATSAGLSSVVIGSVTDSTDVIEGTASAPFRAAQLDALYIGNGDTPTVGSLQQMARPDTLATTRGPARSLVHPAAAADVIGSQRGTAPGLALGASPQLLRLHSLAPGFELGAIIESNSTGQLGLLLSNASGGTDEKTLSPNSGTSPHGSANGMSHTRRTRSNSSSRSSSSRVSTDGRRLRSTHVDDARAELARGHRHSPRWSGQRTVVDEMNAPDHRASHQVNAEQMSLWGSPGSREPNYQDDDSTLLVADGFEPVVSARRSARRSRGGAAMTQQREAVVGDTVPSPVISNQSHALRTGWQGGDSSHAASTGLPTMTAPTSPPRKTEVLRQPAASDAAHAVSDTDRQRQSLQSLLPLADLASTRHALHANAPDMLPQPVLPSELVTSGASISTFGAIGDRRGRGSSSTTVAASTPPAAVAAVVRVAVPWSPAAVNTHSRTPDLQGSLQLQVIPTASGSPRQGVCRADVSPTTSAALLHGATGTMTRSTSTSNFRTALPPSVPTVPLQLAELLGVGPRGTAVFAAMHGRCASVVAKRFDPLLVHVPTWYLDKCAALANDVDASANSIDSPLEPQVVLSLTGHADVFATGDTFCHLVRYIADVTDPVSGHLFVITERVDFDARAWILASVTSIPSGPRYRGNTDACCGCVATHDASLSPYCVLGAPMCRSVLALRGALAGLCALHRAGIVHGSIHPANVVVRRGIVKLADWGLAQATLRAAASELESADCDTAVLRAVGIPSAARSARDRLSRLIEQHLHCNEQWASPETLSALRSLFDDLRADDERILHGADVDEALDRAFSPAADVYALGKVFTHLWMRGVRAVTGIGPAHRVTRTYEGEHAAYGEHIAPATLACALAASDIIALTPIRVPHPTLQRIQNDPPGTRPSAQLCALPLALADLTWRMLLGDPRARLSPQEALCHLAFSSAQHSMNVVGYFVESLASGEQQHRGAALHDIRSTVAGAHTPWLVAAARNPAVAYFERAAAWHEGGQAALAEWPSLLVSRDNGVFDNVHSVNRVLRAGALKLGDFLRLYEAVAATAAISAQTATVLALLHAAWYVCFRYAFTYVDDAFTSEEAIATYFVTGLPWLALETGEAMRRARASNA